MALPDDQVRELLVGRSGVEVVTPAPVAVVIAPHVRALVDEFRRRSGRAASGTVDEVERWVQAVELAAVLYRRGSPSVSSWGHSGGVGDLVAEDGPPNNTGGWVRGTEAADLLGITPRQVRRLAGGQLNARKVGRDLWFEVASIEAYQKTRRRRT